MSLKFGKTIRTLSLSQNYLVLIKKKSVCCHHSDIELSCLQAVQSRYLHHSAEELIKNERAVMMD